jgi:hypothetical protein
LHRSILDGLRASTRKPMKAGYLQERRKIKKNCVEGLAR